MNKITKIFLVLSYLIVASLSLHTQHESLTHDDTSELAALKAQQATFETQVKGIISNLTDAEVKLNKTSNTSEKVILLENEIISERQQIFNLSNSIIPPFNLSKTACQQLTNEQKIAMLDNINKAKGEVAQLKSMASKLPVCTELDQINKDIAKQQFLLNSLQQIINNRCQSSIVLSPTVYQSNLYAPNWILGNQTIDDVIEEYYQRSIQYNSVTNCPDQNPFFDGKVCKQCTTPNPIFNLYSKTCTSCPEDTDINTNLRVCAPLQHYTNYSSVQNWNLDGASGLPQNVNTSLVPCDPLWPYYNGTNCVKCDLPQYWSVKDIICKSCSSGNVFDLNTQSCMAPTGKELTLLQGTKWVTNSSIRNVMVNRANYIKSNPNPTYCGSDTPYFDGIQCISCPYEFSIENKQCTQAANGSVAYDDNVHGYVPVLTNRESYALNNNYLSDTPLIDTDIPDCPKEQPFFDGTTCILCADPFPVFDVAQKKCVTCDLLKIFNNKTHQCQDRPKLYISTNFNRIIATPKESLKDYQNEIQKKIASSKNSIVSPCPSSTQYSDFKQCITCNSDQYFNVETKTCVNCNGTYLESSQSCIPKSTFLTNLTASNLLLPANKTLSDYQKEEQGTVGPTVICPGEKPYAQSPSSCMACKGSDVYFDLQNKTCVQCPEGTAYFNKTMHCQIPTPETNIVSVAQYGNLIQEGNYTLENALADIEAKAANGPLKFCPNEAPIYDGNKCIACPNNTYYNLKTKNCQSAQIITNVKQLIKDNNFVEVKPNYTVSAINESNNKIAQAKPVSNCPSTKPIYNGSVCISCASGTLINLQTLKCQSSSLASNIPAISSSGNFIESGNATLSNLNSSIVQQNATFPVTVCPTDKPFYDGKACIFCNATNNTYYNLLNKTCTLAQYATNANAIQNYIQTPNMTMAQYTAAQQNQQKKSPIQPCPAATPIFVGNTCTVCGPTTPYFNLESQICVGCSNNSTYNSTLKSCVPKPTFSTNADALNNYIESPNYTLADYKANQALKNKTTPLVPCPAATPIFNGTNCTICEAFTPNFDLKTEQCSSCSSDMIYNSSLHKCVAKPPYYTNLGNNNWIVNNVSSIERIQSTTSQLKNTSGSIQCPIGTPFLNTNIKSCMTCPSNFYFNYDTNACVACTTPNQLDYNTHKCSTPTVGVYQTNTNQSNLLFGGLPQQEHVDNYQANVQKYPKIADCKTPTPYFDGFECIACPANDPYFNLVDKLCEQCTAPSTYDPDYHECKNGGQTVATNPNPEQMYSTIF